MAELARRTRCKTANNGSTPFRFMWWGRSIWRGIAMCGTTTATSTLTTTAAERALQCAYPVVAQWGYVLSDFLRSSVHWRRVGRQIDSTKAARQSRQNLSKKDL